MTREKMIATSLTVSEYVARDGVNCVEITASALDGSRLGRVIGRVLDTVDVIYLRVNEELYGAGVSLELLRALERHTSRLVSEHHLAALLEEHADLPAAQKTASSSAV